MKTRNRNPHSRTGILNNNSSPTIERLRTLINFRRQVSAPTNQYTLTQSISNEDQNQLLACKLEAEQRQAAGRVYAGMIPPR